LGDRIKTAGGKNMSNISEEEIESLGNCCMCDRNDGTVFSNSSSVNLQHGTSL
jgi:hypothetical protein